MKNAHLIEGCQALVAHTSDWISRASVVDWQPSQGMQSKQDFFKLILIAVVVKQHESLKVILSLEGAKQAFSAVALLRAMCEELIWLRYLATLSAEEQATVVAALARFGIFETYQAQDGHGIPNLDFGVAWKEQAAASSAESETTLRAFFISQGFKLAYGPTPSVSQLAKRAGMQSTYKLLYHATSRAVHFSVPELLRRVWGRPGEMKITSQTFERYWASFSLYWGGWLFGLTFCDALILLEAPDISSQEVSAILDACLKIKSGGAIPILTPEEVYWPKSWHPAQD